jgi:hypothetical protein
MKEKRKKENMKERKKEKRKSMYPQMEYWFSVFLPAFLLTVQSTPDLYNP